ncbi:hypothetical protein HG530_015604 [Fusarium avenaceum]|nr:hypothetical protein HG530_015604 [Fusarium avenaceum]
MDLVASFKVDLLVGFLAEVLGRSRELGSNILIKLVQLLADDAQALVEIGLDDVLVAVESIEINRLLYHVLQLTQAVRKVAKLGSICLVERVLVILIHDTLKGADESRQANDDLVCTNDIFQIGLTSLESLRESVKVGDRSEVLLL